MPYLPFKRPSRIAIRPRQSIRHDPPPTGVEKKSLWSSSFHCTRAFLAVNEKRGGVGGAGAPDQCQSARPAGCSCIIRLSQSSAGAGLHSAGKTPNLKNEASFFL